MSRRRWLRLVIPYAVVLAIALGAFVVYQIEQPDPTDREFLSPVSTADIGASRLARRLAERGIELQRVTKTSEALVAANADVPGGVTLLVPAPQLVHPFYLRMIKLLPASTRVVLVAPSFRVLVNGRIPAGVAGDRLAARSAAPGCGYGPAASAGRAGVYRLRYEAGSPIEHCYGGALTVLRRGRAEVTLIGAADPFRNDRIGEHGNAALVTGVLAGSAKVIWLDLHRTESMPGYRDDPALVSAPAAPPSLGPGSPDPDFPVPDGYDQHGLDLPSGGQGPVTADPPNPLWQAFPPWVFAAVALGALAFVLFALARGRRLGAPVAEPLPVAVRATETVEGRGRLYRRARARGPAATVLREHATAQLTRLLGTTRADHPDQVGPTDQPGPTLSTGDRAGFATAVADQAGWPTDQVAAVLFGPEPADDRELVGLALALEALLRAVTHRTGRQPDGQLGSDQLLDVEGGSR